MDNGNAQRAVDILEAASQAFPDNLTVRKAVAGGFAHVGRAKEALALFKTVPMQDAAAGDFQGAIGAALAANDKSQAEIWLRQALERFGTDPAILALAARYEQARGDNQRAADYYRASLAAMPQVSPADRLAHVLVYPEPGHARPIAPSPPPICSICSIPTTSPSPKPPSFRLCPPTAPILITPRRLCCPGRTRPRQILPCLAPGTAPRPGARIEPRSDRETRALVPARSPLPRGAYFCASPPC